MKNLRTALSLLCGAMLLVAACASEAGNGDGTAPPPTGAPADGGEDDSTEPTPPEPETVRIAVIGATNEIGFYIAEDRGYFAEAGVIPEFTQFRSGADAISSIGAGDLDVASAPVGAGLNNAVARGVDVRIVAGRQTEDQSIAMLVQQGLIDSGRYRGPEDLRGMSVQFPAPCIGPEATFDAFLKQHGMTIDDIEPTILGFPEVATAMTNASIDVAVAPEPIPTFVESSGDATIVHRFDSGEQRSVTLYSGEFAAREDGLPHRFMVALLKAQRDYFEAFYGSGEGRDYVVDLLVENFALQNPAVYESLAERRVMPYLSPNLALNEESLRTSQEYFLERECQQSAIDLSITVDLTHLESALDELGRVEEANLS